MNRQLHREAMRAAWKDTVKWFSDPSDLESFLRLCSTERLPEHLTMDIKLCFSSTQYLYFFEADMKCIRGAYPYPQRTAGQIFPLMLATGVKHLTLDFESTKQPYSWNPWICHQHAINRNPSRHTCQKMIVEWILRWAKPYLVMLPSVSFGGYIKHSTRTPWDAILRQEQQGSSQSVGVDHLRTLARCQL
jgi:hypothetical protein